MGVLPPTTIKKGFVMFLFLDEEDFKKYKKSLKTRTNMQTLLYSRFSGRLKSVHT